MMGEAWWLTVIVGGIVGATIAKLLHFIYEVILCRYQARKMIRAASKCQLRARFGGYGASVSSSTMKFKEK